MDGANLVCQFQKHSFLSAEIAMSAGKAAGKERKDLFDERKDSAKKQNVKAWPQN
jgi:hypothetical protein